MKDEISQGISILIPTWNNLKYLKLCVDSIRKNSLYSHEIILHINDGSDGTLEWAKQENLKYSYSQSNVGVCKSMNTAFTLSTKDIIGYFNDDMVALPGWDEELDNFLKTYQPEENNIIISSTMIEPRGHNDCCIAPLDYGQDIDTFRYNDLLKNLDEIRKLKPNIKGTTWPPNYMHRSLWNLIDGYSEDFSPGYGSDPDLIKKAYDKGTRNFVSIGASLVYHFGSKTTGIKQFHGNDGEGIFLQKHNITIQSYVYNVLKRTEKFENLEPFYK